jgi:hypothetical protein
VINEFIAVIATTPISYHIVWDRERERWGRDSRESREGRRQKER